MEVPPRDRLDDGELHAKQRGQLQIGVQEAAPRGEPAGEAPVAAAAGAAAAAAAALVADAVVAAAEGLGGEP